MMEAAGKAWICGLFFVLALVSFRQEAEACSCGSPMHLGFVASAEELVVPRDFGGLAFMSKGTLKREQFAFTLLADEKDPKSQDQAQEIFLRELTEVRGEYRLFVIQPAFQLLPGRRYRVKTDLDVFAPGGQGGERTFTVTDQLLPGKIKKQPMRLSAEISDGELNVPSGGSCGRVIESRKALLRLTLPKWAQPYRELFLFETIVDGERWHYRSSLCSLDRPGRSSILLGEDLIYPKCESDPLSRRGIDEGQHQVQIRAILPTRDGVERFASKTIVVDLRCPTKKSSPTD